MFGATAFIRYLASLGGLAAGLTEQHAADLCWALMDGHLYQLLVIQRGWTPPTSPSGCPTPWRRRCCAAEADQPQPRTVSPSQYQQRPHGDRHR